jgi:hypothetical protein
MYSALCTFFQIFLGEKKGCIIYMYHKRVSIIFFSPVSLGDIEGYEGIMYGYCVFLHEMRNTEFP